MTLFNPPSFLQNRTDHTAVQTRLMLRGLVKNSGVGTIGDLAVTAQTVPNMTVRVAAGRCWIVGTSSAHQGIYHCYNDGTVNATVTASSPTLPRKDILIAEIRDQFYSGSSNDWQLRVVAGTPAASPAEPAVPANSLRLATIDVAAAATTITNANITPRASLATSGLASGTVAVTSITRPPNPSLGDTILETDKDRYRMWNGSRWLFLGGRPPHVTTFISANLANAVAVQWNSIPWNGSADDIDNMWTGVGIPARLVAPETGLYHIDAMVEMVQPGSSVHTWIGLRRNGSTTNFRRGDNGWQIAGQPSEGLSATTDWRLSAGDYIEVMIYNSIPHTIQRTPELYSPRCTMTLIGS